MKSVQFGGVNNTDFPTPLSVHLLFHQTLLIASVIGQGLCWSLLSGIRRF